MKNEYIEYIKKYVSSDRLDDALKKLESGVSPQYIVGNVEFYGRVFNVNESVLIPRFETELLVEKTISYIKKMFNSNNINILDIGTGSGCIAITLNKELGCSCMGVDISKDALVVARDNADINGACVDFMESDLFNNVRDRYDVIISNPPYIAYDEMIEDVVFNNEPHMALFAKDKGLYFYKEIIKNMRNYLKDRFIVAFEIGYLQGNDIRDYVYEYFDNVDVYIEKDYSDKDRFVFIVSRNI